MLVGLCKILNDGNGQDLAAVAEGVNESELNLVDVIGHVPYTPASHNSNLF